MIQICRDCLLGQHDKCANTYLDYHYCTCEHTSTLVDVQAPLSAIGAALIDPADALSGTSDDELGNRFKRRLKDEGSLKDIQSTGRKRAAVLYPLKDENGRPIPCDFAGRRNVLPNFMQVQIDGCGTRQGTVAGIAQARHHHNYTVTDNERSNVGLLCHSCHNLLHSKNDPFKDQIYERIYGFKPELADLSHAAKALKSGVVSGGHITESKDDA